MIETWITAFSKYTQLKIFSTLGKGNVTQLSSFKTTIYTVRIKG